MTYAPTEKSYQDAVDTREETLIVHPSGFRPNILNKERGNGRATATRKAEIILQILRQTTTVVDVARQNDLTPSEVQDWIDTFLKAAIGDLYVKNATLRKAKALWGTSEETES